MAKERGEEWKEYDKAVRWMTISFFICLALSIVLFVCAPALFQLVREGVSKTSLDKVNRFFNTVMKNPDYLFSFYGKWGKLVFNHRGSFALYMWMPLLPFITIPVGLIVSAMFSPYKFQVNYQGQAKIADLRDIKKMSLLGFDGFCQVVGKFDGKFLMLKETLATLCCAPPGTGKTAGVVIPTIFNSDKLSIIVNDPKPELCYSTSGARSKVGPVFIINWGAEDNPSEGIYYPSWNPLSPNCIPEQGPDRDMYVDSMCNILVEDPKGGADPHWSQTGRAALTGFIQFVVSKCDRARANDYFIGRIYEGKLDEKDKEVLEGYYMDMRDPGTARAIQNLKNGTLTMENYLPIGTWNLLPSRWMGREACIAMIMEWITEAQINAAQEIQRRLDEGDQMAAMADPTHDMLEEAIKEARNFGYAQRCITELSTLSNTPDKERGSILSTAFAGINVFKNQAVKARTSFSDLQFRDLRGMKDPVTGEWKPISVYLSVNQVDARALGVISSTFIELMSSYLISNPPNHVNKTEGKMGPFPALFILDEFPQMPKMKAIIDGPAVGRGQKVSYLLIGQDLGQISGKYGKDDLETVISTTACKVILSQNNEVTAQRFSKMIGNKTVQMSSFSRTEGSLGKDFNPLAKNVNYQLQGIPVISSTQLLSLPMLKQVVLMQSYIDRPIMADSPRWYLDKKMRKLAAIPACPNVPDWIVAQREDINDDMLAKLGIEYNAEEGDGDNFEIDNAPMA